jgi:Rubber elongation factor protein (REF)
VVESVQEIEKHIPGVVKEAPNMVQSVAEEVHRAGVVGTAAGLARNAFSCVEPMAKDIYSKYEPVANDLYTKYEPEAEKHAVVAWRALNRLPLVPQVAHVVVPTAANLSHMYNHAVSTGAERGYKVAAFLPLVPTEKIARVFAEEEPAAAEMEPISVPISAQ